MHHNKREKTLGQLRTRFWIIRGRPFVKKTLRAVQCVADMKGAVTEYPLRVTFQSLD